MSYDLYLLREDEIGDDPAAAYARLPGPDDLDEDCEPTAEDEVRLRSLAADLQATSPGLDLSEPERGFMLQLGYDAERPVVIDIGTDAVTMSWSYGADDAAPAVAEVAVYLPVFRRHGYVAYDPQLERLFDVERDAAEAESMHRHVQVHVFGEPAGPSWWRRLGGR